MQKFSTNDCFCPIGKYALQVHTAESVSISERSIKVSTKQAIFWLQFENIFGYKTADKIVKLGLSILETVIIFFKTNLSEATK